MGPRTHSSSARVHTPLPKSTPLHTHAYTHIHTYTHLHKPTPRDRAQWEREAAFIAEHKAQCSDLIEINIGGKHFVTVPRSMLTQEDNMLAAMFSGRHKVHRDDEV